MNSHTYKLAFASLGLALALPLHAHAQTMSYDGSGKIAAGDDDEGDGDSRDSRHGRGRSGKRVTVTPYLEASQVATAELSPGSEFLTYTSLAAGVDAQFNGRNTNGAASVRYERRIGYGKTADGDTISGIARVGVALVPQAVNFEAGAMAARTKVEANGSIVPGASITGGGSTQVWSVYAGPTIKAHAGDVAIDGGYRIGYTKVGTDSNIATAVGGPAVDVFDHSTVHNAELHLGTKAGTVLPVGVGAGGGYYQEDISNLDQRVRDLHGRVDVTLPVSRDLALVGGVGYEDVQISARDVQRDVSGNPVIGANGRYVTDKASPRVMAYDTSGLIWDAGVMWRPSRRTALEAHVGKRYGTTSYYGSLAYAPNNRMSVNVAVYDNIAGFGGQMNKALANLPTNFQANRNPLTGELNTCLASLEGGNCLGNALGSVRSSTFRSRGVAASLGYDLGNLQAGFGLGYDRRKFIAAPGTILASANGVVDENYWMSAYLSGRVDSHSRFSTNVYATWFQSGFATAEDGTTLGATAAYYRNITDHLTANLAVGVDGLNRETLPDLWSASALVGVRYSF
ncbi:MAG: preprotein translocase subunit YajC [Novosphingobium sp.]